ncbi:MAG: TrkH family potassium uptake protein [Fibrobacteria bacterium]|nr:TrkH family potassium uptake protein [Fibrobacteria bacterium]
MLNFPFVIHILGFFLMGLAVAMLVPTGMAWYFGEVEITGFIFSTLITLVTGFIMFRVKPFHKKLRLKSSILIVAFGWMAFSLFGSLPYYFCNVLSITDSVFETMSGFTTTGATVILNIEEDLSKSLLFWRSFTQWMGGMGIIVLSLAIMPLLGAGGAVLYRAEVPGPSSDKIMPRLQATAKILWVVYVAFTVVLAILLKLFDMSWFDAINHAMTTLSTGGFSTRNASVAAFNSPAIEWSIIVFMFIGGANYSLHYKLFVHGHVRAFRKNREFLFYTLIILLATVGISFEMGFFHNTDSALDLLRDAMFQVVSIVTTTGYITSDYELWGQFSQYIIFLLMFVGGCGGSTGGGIKVIRVYISIKIALLQIAQMLHPNAVYFIKVGKTTVSEEMVGRVMGFIILYIWILGIASLLLTFFGHDFVTSISAVASCLGNIGPGFGEVGAVDNYYMVHESAKWVLTFCMLAGRLELFTILVLFSGGFWKR